MEDSGLLGASRQVAVRLYGMVWTYPATAPVPPVVLCETILNIFDLFKTTNNNLKALLWVFRILPLF